MYKEKIPSALPELEKWVSHKEKIQKNLKKGTAAEIIWAYPPRKSKTSLSILYLHGFKASHGEGFPIHRNIAKKLHANLFLSRLHGHGLQVEVPYHNFNIKEFILSAQQAIEITQKLGNKVIIMGTSTGASLALYLASLEEYKKSIHSLVLYSPLINFFGPKSLLLTTNAGRRLLKIYPGERFLIESPANHPAEELIWYSQYQLKGVLELGKFVQQKMTQKRFKQIIYPTFVGYYYKNFWEKDTVVSTRKIKQMFELLATPEYQKEIRNFPHAQTHVISNGLLSKSVNSLEQKTLQFLKKHS